MADTNHFEKEESRSQCLATPRFTVLLTNRQEGMPVRFDWDGEFVRLFVGKYTPKACRLRSDSKASVLVTNHIDSPERWVAFDGLVTISDDGGFDLAERLALRYWDLKYPAKRKMFEGRRGARDDFSLLHFEPTKISTGG